MKGNKIELLLHTPILIEVPEEPSSQKTRTETITKILGTVIELSEAGLTLEWTELFTERKQKLVPARRWVFIPLHKIDHLLSVN